MYMSQLLKNILGIYRILITNVMEIKLLSIIFAQYYDSEVCSQNLMLESIQR
jgi:hypothetical protein